MTTWRTYSLINEKRKNGVWWWMYQEVSRHAKRLLLFKENSLPQGEGSSCMLTWLGLGKPIAGKALLLGVFFCFCVCISTPNKEHSSANNGQPSKAQIEHKGRGRVDLPRVTWSIMLLILQLVAQPHPSAFVPVGVKPLGWDWTTPSCFLVILTLSSRHHVDHTCS